jgi:hypothetical protein
MATQLPQIFMSNFLDGDAKAIALPSDFPKTVATPKYPLGSRCRWIPTPQTDWGTVIGQIYVPNPISQNKTTEWSWVYLLLLDLDSPSKCWVAVDWVSEDDLETLPPISLIDQEAP